jgi:O-antigen ligase
MIPQGGMMVERPSAVRFQGPAFVIVAAILIFVSFAPKAFAVVFGVLVGLPLAGYLVFKLIDGSADSIVLSWVGLFPLGYYFLVFPREHAVVTFDRVAVLMMAVAMAFCPRTKFTAVPHDLRKSALAWIGFLLAAFVSLVNVGDILTPTRVWVDAFLLPAVFAWYVIACFPVRMYLRALHVLACVAAIYSAAIGVAEVALGTDLLPLPGAGETFAGAQDVLVLRVNGPYLSNNSFGLIGLISFCLIWFLRSAIAERMPRWQKALNALGIIAALTSAILPLFRSVFLTIALILVLDLFRKMSFRQRAVRLGVLGLMAASVLVLMLSVPELFQERVSDSGNISARLAQQKQNLRLFLDHPVFGVGLYNFNATATTTAKAQVSYNGVTALDYPHSNIGAVLAETGLAGFAPYVASSILLVIAFWRLRRNAKADGRLAWMFFLYIFLSYWISGLALTSGYYSDLNLWSMFSIAILYKYVLTGQPEIAAFSKV